MVITWVHSHTHLIIPLVEFHTLTRIRWTLDMYIMLSLFTDKFLTCMVFLVEYSEWYGGLGCHPGYIR